MTTLFQAAWWTSSRTMYFNLLCAIVGLFAEFVPAIQASLPVNVYAALTTVLLVGNTILRVLTQIKLTAQ